MQTQSNQKEITLTVEFINRKYVNRKMVTTGLSGNRYAHTGSTKKECIAKAKQACRYNSSYQKSFTTI